MRKYIDIINEGIVSEAINVKAVGEKISNLLKGEGWVVQQYDDAELTVNPQEANRFVVDDPNVVVRLSVNDNAIKLYTSEDLNEHPIRKQLKNLADKFLLQFDYQVFNKKLKAAGEELDIAQNSEKDMADVMEASLGSMSGSKKTSHQTLEAVKIIVKHRAAVNEESRGARSRNIHSIFIQRAGERFRMQETNLTAARAMARHMNNGGDMHDTVGGQITSLAEDFRKLKVFCRYVNRTNMVNETNEEYVNLAKESVQSIKSMFSRMSKANGYAQAISEMDSYLSTNTEILEDGEIDLEAAFTEKHFDDKVSNAIGSLTGLLGKQQSYRAAITLAVESETFDGFKDTLSENLVEFEGPRQQLAHQVTQMGTAATNEQLGTFLRGVGQKINDGGGLNQFEYSTVKASLLSVNEPKLKENKMPKDVMENYEELLDSFIK